MFKTAELPASILSSSKLTIPQAHLLIPDVVAVIDKEREMMEKVLRNFLKSQTHTF